MPATPLLHSLIALNAITLLSEQSQRQATIGSNLQRQAVESLEGRRHRATRKRNAWLRRKHATPTKHFEDGKRLTNGRESSD